MRVISGELRGRKLEKLEGMDIRPTSDRVKESLFNILGIKIYDCEFLDLFAGTGGIGIEAYSRGASKVVFIDESAKSVQVLRGNLEKLKVLDKVEVYNTDYTSAITKLARDNRKFDFIFIDPPYLKGYAQNSLTHISEQLLLKEDGIVIVEHDMEDAMPEAVGSLKLHRQKKYGKTILSFFAPNSHKEE